MEIKVRLFYGLFKTTMQKTFILYNIDLSEGKRYFIAHGVWYLHKNGEIWTYNDRTMYYKSAREAIQVIKKHHKGAKIDRSKLRKEV